MKSLTRERMLDYLASTPATSRCFGIGEGARLDPEGVGRGGSGLFLAPGDLLKIAETLNASGMHSRLARPAERVVDRLQERRWDAAAQSLGRAAEGQAAGDRCGCLRTGAG